MVEGPLSLAARIHALDSEDMFGHVSRFVDDLEAALVAVDDRTCPWLAELRTRTWAGVLCLGMGGSAAGGSFLSSLADRDGTIPVLSHADAALPGWVSENGWSSQRPTPATPPKP